MEKPHGLVSPKTSRVNSSKSSLQFILSSISVPDINVNREDKGRYDKPLVTWENDKICLPKDKS